MQSTKQVPNGGSAFDTTSKIEDTSSYVRFALPQANDNIKNMTSHQLPGSAGTMASMRPPSSMPFYHQQRAMIPRSAVINQPVGHYRALPTVEASRIVSHQPPSQTNPHGYYTVFLGSQTQQMDGQPYTSQMTTAGPEYATRNPNAAYPQAFFYPTMMPYAAAPQAAQQGWPTAAGMPPVGMPTAGIYGGAPHNVVPLMTPSQGSTVYQTAPGVAPPGALLGPAVGQSSSGITTHGQQAPSAQPQVKREKRILQFIDPTTQKDVMHEVVEEKQKLQQEQQQHLAATHQNFQPPQGTVYYTNSGAAAPAAATPVGSTTPSPAVRYTHGQPAPLVGASVGGTTAATGAAVAVQPPTHFALPAQPTPRAAGADDDVTTTSTTHGGEPTAQQRPKQSPSPTAPNAAQQPPDDEKKNMIYCELALNIAEVAGPDSSSTTASTAAKPPPPSKIVASSAAADARRPALTDITTKKVASDAAGSNATGYSFGFFDEQDKASAAQTASKHDAARSTVIPTVSVTLNTATVSSGERNQVAGASVVTTTTSTALSSKITAAVTSATSSSSIGKVDHAEKEVKPEVTSHASDNVDDFSFIEELRAHKSPTSWFFDNPSGAKVYSRDYMITLAKSPMSQVAMQLAAGISDVTDIRSRSSATENYLRDGRSPYDQSLGGLAPGGRAPMHFDVGGGQQSSNFKPSWMGGSSQASAAQKRYTGRSSAGRGPPGGGGGAGPRGSQDGGGRPPPMIIPRPSLNAAEVQLKRTENAWKPVRIQSDATKDPEQTKTDMLNRDVKSILNKITPQTFDDLSKDFLNLEPRIDTEDRVNGVIDILFSKVCDEPSFSGMYARLCELFRNHQMVRLQQEQQAVTETFEDSKSKLKGFNFYLLSKCQRDFEQEKSTELQREQKVAEIERAPTEEEKKRLKDNLEEELNKFKWRILGSMRFVGELYKLGLLTNFIAHICVMRLLEKTSIGEEDHAECVCKLLATIGQKMLDGQAVPSVDPTKRVPRDWMLKYFENLKSYLTQQKFSKRIQFEIRNLLELKENNWIPRRRETGPKTLEEVHSEAQLEDYAKKAELDQYSMRKQSLHQQQQPYQQQQYQGQLGGRGNPKSGRMPQQRGSYGNLNTSVAEDEPSSGAGGTMGRKKSQANRSNDVRQQQRDSLGGGRQSGGRMPPQAGASSTSSDSRTMAVPSSLSRHNVDGAAVSLQPAKKNWNKTATQQAAATSVAITANRFANLAPEDESKMSAPNSRDSSQSRLSAATAAPSLRPGGGSALSASSSAPPPSSLPPPLSADVGGKVAFDTTSSGSSREASLTRGQSTPRTAMDMKKLKHYSTELFDEYSSNGDYEETSRLITDRANYAADILVFVLEHVLEKTEKDRQKMADLWAKLLKNSAVDKPSIVEGFTRFAQSCVENGMETDVPLLWSYLGSILGGILAIACRSVKDGPLNTSHLCRAFLAAENRTRKFLGHTLEKVHFADETGATLNEIFAGDCWSKYGFSNREEVEAFLKLYKLTDLLNPDIDRPLVQIMHGDSSSGLADRLDNVASNGSLGSTDMDASHATSDLSGGSARLKNVADQPCLLDLGHYIKSLNPVEPHKLITYIMETIPEPILGSEGLACALAHSLCSKFFLSVADNNDSALTITDQFEQCCPVFHRFITGNTHFEKLLLSTLADMYYSQACPKDILTTTFETLSANNVMSRETFLDWWNSDEAQNRGMILKSNHMKTFFDNLQRQHDISRPPAASFEVPDP